MKLLNKNKFDIKVNEQSKQLKFLFRITLTLTGQKQPVANKNRCPQNVKNFREKAFVDALCLLDVDNDPTV